MSRSLPGEVDWWGDVWLVALDGDVAPDEIRAFWNLRHAPTLEALMEKAPAVDLGLVYAYPPDGYDVGPARRVSDLLYERATVPEYSLPIVDEELIAAIEANYRPREGDFMPAASSPTVLDRFLRDHRGWKLVKDERAP